MAQKIIRQFDVTSPTPAIEYNNLRIFKEKVHYTQNREEVFRNIQVHWKYEDPKVPMKARKKLANMMRSLIPKRTSVVLKGDSGEYILESDIFARKGQITPTGPRCRGTSIIRHHQRDGWKDAD